MNDIIKQLDAVIGAGADSETIYQLLDRLPAEQRALFRLGVDYQRVVAVKHSAGDLWDRAKARETRTRLNLAEHKS